jgi:DNA-binding response OmpR family regulator
VEDEQAVRMVAARVLRRKGFNVLEAIDGRDALAVAGDHLGSIALLITDLIMPSLDGPQLAVTLGQTRPTMRVLFMSGYLEEDIAGRGVQLDASFLGKPFLPDDLVARVESLLGTTAATDSAV